jgi:hypothetical protein
MKIMLNQKQKRKRKIQFVAGKKAFAEKPSNSNIELFSLNAESVKLKIQFV